MKTDMLYCYCCNRKFLDVMWWSESYFPQFDLCCCCWICSAKCNIDWRLTVIGGRDKLSRLRCGARRHIPRLSALQYLTIRTSHCPRAPGQGINLGGGKGGESTFREFYPFQNNVCSSDFNLNGLRVMLLFRVRSLDAYFVFCTCEYGPTAIDAEFGRLRTLMISDQLKHTDDRLQSTESVITYPHLIKFQMWMQTRMWKCSLLLGQL